MDEKLVRIARWLEKQPWNKPGADKTWVLRGADVYRRWSEAIRDARRLPKR